jgi:BlaI family penicillinase repressor
MRQPKLSDLELKIMDGVWTHGVSSIREIHERFPPAKRPAYTSVQTMVNRLEAKKALVRVRKVGSAHLYEAAISRNAVRRRLISDFMPHFGGKASVLMACLVEAGNLSLDDIRQVEILLHDLRAKKDQP